MPCAYGGHCLRLSKKRPAALCAVLLAVYGAGGRGFGLGDGKHSDPDPCGIGCCGSKSFIVSGLTFRSLIHFEFIFVYGVRKCSSFILLQVVDQSSQHHLLKRLSLIHCIFLPPLSKIRCPYVCGFISGLSILFH